MLSKKEAAWVGGGMLASIVAMLVGTRLLTQLLPTAEYGRVALAMTIATFVVQGLATPVSLMTMRFFAPMRARGELRYLLSDSYRINGGVLVVTAALALVGVAGAPFIRIVTFLPAEIVLIGTLSILLAIIRAALGLEDAAQERPLRAILQGGHDVTRFALAVVTLLALGRGTAEAVLYGFCAAAALSVLGHVVLMRPRLDAIARAELGARQTPTRVLTQFMWPLFASNIALWFVMMSERWVLAWTGSLSEVGGYAAIYQIAFLPMTLISGFLLVLSMPILYRRIGTAADEAAVSQALRPNLVFAGIVFIVTLGGFALGLVGHELICGWLLGPEYRGYSWIFPWLLLAGGCFATAQQLLLKLTSTYRTAVLAYLWMFLAALACLTYAVFAAFWKLPGLVWGVVLINVSLLVLAAVLTGTGPGVLKQAPEQ